MNPRCCSRSRGLPRSRSDSETTFWYLCGLRSILRTACSSSSRKQSAALSDCTESKSTCGLLGKRRASVRVQPLVPTRTPVSETLALNENRTSSSLSQALWQAPRGLPSSRFGLTTEAIEPGSSSFRQASVLPEINGCRSTAQTLQASTPAPAPAPLAHWHIRTQRPGAPAMAGLSQAWLQTSREQHVSTLRRLFCDHLRRGNSAEAAAAASALLCICSFGDFTWRVRPAL